MLLVVVAEAGQLFLVGHQNIFCQFLYSTTFVLPFFTVTWMATKQQEDR